MFYTTFQLVSDILRTHNKYNREEKAKDVRQEIFLKKLLKEEWIYLWKYAIKD